MKSVFRWRAANALWLALACAWSAPTWSQDTFPEGEGRNILLAACSQCHTPLRILHPHTALTADDWEFILYNMIARGAPVYKKDIPVLKKYLIENFAVENRSADTNRPTP